MSWSDDMRCLYCDGKLPLYRKVTHGQFCSGAHRKAYWKEQERLAVERLHQTHTSLQAYRPPAPVEVILGPAVEDAEPVVADLAPFFTPQLLPCGLGRMDIVALDLLAYETQLNPAWPHTQFVQGELKPAVAGLIPFAWVLAAGSFEAGLPAVSLADSYETDVHPAWPNSQFPQGDLQPAIAGLVPRDWVLAAKSVVRACGRPVQNESLEPCVAGLPFVLLADSMARESAGPGFAGFIVPVAGRVDCISIKSLAARPPQTVNLAVQAVMDEFLPPPARRPAFPPWIGAILRSEALESLLDSGELSETEIPRPDRLLRLARFAARPYATARAVGGESELSSLLHAVFPDLLHPELAVVWVQTGLRRLAMIPAVLPHVPGLETQGLGMQGEIGHSVEGDVVVIGISTPPPEPCLRMAACTRSARESGRGLEGLIGLESRPAEIRAAQIDPAGWLPDAEPLEVIPPQRRERVVPELAGPFPCERLLSLGVFTGDAFLRPRGIAAPLPTSSAAGAFPQPLVPAALYPNSKLEPLDAKPAADFVPSAFVPPASSAGAGRSEMPPDGVLRAGEASAEPKLAARLKPVAHVWTQAAGFWQHAPRDLKLLALAIPALIALAFHPHLPKVRVAAPTTTGHLGHNLETVVDGQWTSMKQAVFDRAAVALDEDFRQGLDQWISRGDATTQWSFDATGFVRPGPLALYRPSMGLTDYQMQFLGMIDKKALSWVVRAADFNNYYVVKLVVLKPGPLTTVGITRYAVINGKAENRADTVVPLNAQPDTLYRVSLDVHGDTFSLMIQGAMVDTWTEPQLRHGGIGFFSARGEEGRVRWVQVTHQYDMLGRLCAYLAPYGSSNTSGSW
jgi:hypothetical protein